MKMKKILSLTLAILLLFGLFGCGQQSQPLDTVPSKTVSAGTEESTAPPETTEPTTEPTEPASIPATDPTEATEVEQSAEAPKETELKKQTSEPETKPTNPAPATEPSTTQPPATEPAETQPQETKPAETEPPSTEPPATEPPTEATEPEAYEITAEFKRQVAKYAIQYINQYRAEAGVQSLTYLPGMTLVAEYRADQLTYNFSHSTADKREALAYYQYGRYIDATLAGLSESDSYYEADSAEAICAGFKGVDAEALGKYIARLIRNSSSHWSYVGSGEYSYIGVGVEYREGSEYGWYACVMVGSVNYG